MCVCVCVFVREMRRVCVDKLLSESEKANSHRRNGGKKKAELQ